MLSIFIWVPALFMLGFLLTYVFMAFSRDQRELSHGVLAMFAHTSPIWLTAWAVSGWLYIYLYAPK